jgi:hypothetical protein
VQSYLVTYGRGTPSSAPPPAAVLGPRADHRPSADHLPGYFRLGDGLSRGANVGTR